MSLNIKKNPRNLFSRKMSIFLETHSLFEDGFWHNFFNSFVGSITCKIVCVFSSVFLRSICPLAGHKFSDKSSVSPPSFSIYFDRIRTAVLVFADDDTRFGPLFGLKILDQHLLARVQVLRDLGMVIKILLGAVPCGSVLLLGSMRSLRWITYRWKTRI